MECQVLSTCLSEEVGIKGGGSRIEGCPRNGRVNMVLSSDAVGRQKVDDFIWAESSIAHTSNDSIDRVGWFGNQQVGSGKRNVEPPSKELQARSPQAVGDTDSTSELNADWSQLHR